MLNHLTTEIVYYKALSKDPSVLRASKWLLAAAVGYLLSPIDLIPDFIPILGQVDDLIIVLFLVWSALLLIPGQIKMRIREEITNDC
ncbi:MAG: DUF1232 domain-containing protein [Gammaproteobacteria bacterium]|nr:DUF1232 domain-containing protein [Gammaproteobacteria bacterium]